MKILDPKNDFLFKRLFGTERTRDLLLQFLNDVFAGTREPIESLQFIKTSMNPRFAAERQSMIDVLCQDIHGNKFIIEMQVGKEKGFEKRAPYYAANAYVSQRSKSKKYHDLKEVVFLAILNHTMFPKKKAHIHHHVILDKETSERDLKGFSFSFIELGKFKKKIHELETVMSADMKRGSDEGKLEFALDEGIEKGREEGRAESKREIAKNLLAQGVSLDLITAAKGIPTQEIAIP